MEQSASSVNMFKNRIELHIEEKIVGPSIS